MSGNHQNKAFYLPAIDHLDIWSSAWEKKASGGRGGNGKLRPYGIQKLRELILELAVRGRLVPQDPNDEPASVLLEKIAEEKARLVKEGKIKKPKELPEITEKEKPFELPEGWEWVYLNDIGYWGAGATPNRRNPKYYGGTIPWFKSGELIGDFISKPEEHVTDLALKECSLRYNQPGDVLIAMYGATIGKTSILSVPATTNQAVCACTPLTGVFNRYLLTLLKAYKYRFTGMGAGGAQPNISREKIIATAIALPPETEQHRIVAKVDELMALCDRLEQEQADSLQAHQTLVETLLRTLTDAPNAEAAQQAWQRIARHFDLLFTTETAIDQLKQTILQLAVMGKLVPQDPNDEPASVLLEKIAEEKARLVKEGKIKKPKKLPEISDEENRFELPEGWVWASLSHLGVFSGGKTPSKNHPEYWNGDIPWVTPKDMGNVEIHDSIDHVTRKSIEDGLGLNEPESILFVVRSGILRRKFPVAVAKTKCTVNQDLKVLSPYCHETSTYICLMMNGFQSYILENLTKSGMTVESIVFDKFSTHYFPLPPLAEQHRIVAKVDELMALYDALKARIQEAETNQLHLADAVVEQAVGQ